MDVEYLIDTGAGTQRDGALDLPIDVMRQLGIRGSGRRMHFVGCATAVQVEYELARVRVEFTQPNGDTRERVLTAAVRDDLADHELPLFGLTAMMELGLHVETPSSTRRGAGSSSGSVMASAAPAKRMTRAVARVIRGDGQQ